MAHTVVQSVQTYVNDFLQSNGSSSEEGVSLEAAQSVVVTIVNQLQQYKLAVAAILGAIIIATLLRRRQKLPPGVKPLPMLPGLPWAGRFWDVPEAGIEAAWHFGALHKKMGPIYAWKVMGITHVWIETDKVARDLFVLRQRKYCDRNELPAAVGIQGGKEVLPLMGYSDTFKRYKNFMHFIMKDANPKAFYGWPAEENKKTLRRLLESPEQWSEHMLVHCARTIGSIAWGNPEHGKKLLYIVPELLKAVSPAGPLINKLTFLMYLPEWLSPWKQAETRRRIEMTEAFTEALDDVKRRVDAGTAEECWSMLWLTNNKGSEAKSLDHYEAAHAIGSSSFVAIATIGGPLHGFFTAVCHYPHWLKELQEEVDRVCGDRLPVPEDMPQMPKLRATVKEVLRWRQSTPLGVPHITMEDDIYNGYFIPKGVICHANNFLISREPHQFPRPEEFVPERWVDPSYPTYKEPLTEFPHIRGDIAFGYGARACPGVDLTNVELFTLFGALAWAFNIAPKEEGQKLPWYEVNPWVITMCKPFPIKIEARTEDKRRWVMAQDPGYWLTSKPETKWDIKWENAEKQTYGEDRKPWTWEECSVPWEQPEHPVIYPPGV